jgi:hypothetical protein
MYVAVDGKRSKTSLKRFQSGDVMSVFIEDVPAAGKVLCSGAFSLCGGFADGP